MNDDQMLKDLEDLPNVIAHEEKKYVAIVMRKNELNSKIKHFSNKLMIDVFNDTTEGKSTFSSKDKREIEHQKRMSSNTDYKQLREEAAKQELKRKEVEIEIECLKRRFSSIKYLIMFLTGKNKTNE